MIAEKHVGKSIAETIRSHPFFAGLAKPDQPDGLAGLTRDWDAAWPEALACWSRFVKLSSPRWCLTEADEEQEGLTSSFAMIRLTDHAVVVSLRQVRDQGLQDHAREILAHEVGHHVLAPADLRDNARLLARVRRGLPGREDYGPLVANLYTDLLINDRLQRDHGLDMAGVYTILDKGEPAGTLWSLCMRICEILWSLPRQSLCHKGAFAGLGGGPSAGKAGKGGKGGKKKAASAPNMNPEGDASLGARLARTYARDWLAGAGRFAALCLPYLMRDTEKGEAMAVWLDALAPGAGGEIPDGLTGVDADELEGALHPALDAELTGLSDMGEEEGEDARTGAEGAGGRARQGGGDKEHRTPQEYRELMKGLGVELPPEEMVAAYYRERALPHLVPYPSRTVRQAADPLPEGLAAWDAGDELSTLDWMESLVRSPYVIPGVTTVQRDYGQSQGNDPEKRPVDFYLGVDCSGSMINPAVNLSYPVLAGAVITLSALRAGARAMITLSGEPGEYSQTDGFIRDEKTLLRVLTGYLGTGYAFGILRLKQNFLDVEPSRFRDRPAHIMLVTDSDIFTMLNEVPDGWGIAAQALEWAGGGGTMVLHMPYRQSHEAGQERLKEQGWDVHLLSTWEDLVRFARAFSRRTYGDKP